MRTAVSAAARLRRRLILLGVEADGPETGYGWIAPGDSDEAPSGAELYLVRRFWEKPDQPTAAHLLAHGYFGIRSFWSGGWRHSSGWPGRGCRRC